jgi:hypothetical protein
MRSLFRNFAIFLPIPAESRNRCTSNAESLKIAFGGVLAAWADTRRTALDNIRDTSTGTLSVDCSIVHTSMKSLAAAAPPWSFNERCRLADLQAFLAPESFSKGLAHFQCPVIFDVALPPESIHEQIDARTRGADHFRQHLVAYNGNLSYRPAVILQMR